MLQEASAQLVDRGPVDTQQVPHPVRPFARHRPRAERPQHTGAIRISRSVGCCPSIINTTPCSPRWRD
jgi:hypothetical protein